MLRQTRHIPSRLRLQRIVVRQNAYSTEQPPVKEPITTEVEKADHPKLVELRTKQAPNRDRTWAPSQRPRSDAFNQARFEDTIIQLQPQPAAAIELIAQQPIRYINERIAICDGGGGPRGHPRIYINVDQPGPHPCGYCGLRFAATKEKHEALSAVGGAA